MFSREVIYYFGAESVLVPESQLRLANHYLATASSKAKQKPKVLIHSTHDHICTAILTRFSSSVIWLQSDLTKIAYIQQLTVVTVHSTISRWGNFHC